MSREELIDCAGDCRDVADDGTDLKVTAEEDSATGRDWQAREMLAAELNEAQNLMK